MNKKIRILLIDDEPDILEVVAMLLTREGFEVDIADCGEDAIKKLSEHTYDLAVSDYLMPQMDGIEILKLLRGKKNYTPFIFFSGNADDSHGLKMTGLGAYQLLPKTQVMELADVIKNTIKVDTGLQSIGLDVTKDQDEFLALLHSA